MCSQPNCGASSEPQTHNTFVYYTYVASWEFRSIFHLLIFRHIFTRNTRGISFGSLLKKSVEEDTRPCTNEVHISIKCNLNFQKCGQPCKLVQYLFNSPKYFVVGLVWHSDVPSSSHIKNVFDQIDERISLDQIFEKYPTNTSYRLKGT